MWNDVRAQPSLETTAWSLLLAFLGAIVSMYVVGVVGAAGQDPAYGPPLTFIAFPLMGAIVAVPLRLAATLLTWACFVLTHRWVQRSRAWARVTAVATTVVVCAVFYSVVGLVLPTLREPLPLFAFALALVVVLAVCVARNLGRPRGVDAAGDEPVRTVIPDA